MAIVLAIISLLTGCETTSHAVAKRDISAIMMGLSVDGRNIKIIKDGNQVLPVSEVFDPILSDAGFELSWRDWSYGLSPHTGTTYTSAYWLRRGPYSGCVLCVTVVDMKSVSISFETYESGHNKKDFPPSEEVRALAAPIRPKIMDVLSSRFPDRAIQVTELYWKDN